MLKHAFLCFVRRARAIRLCVLVEIFLRRVRDSLISYTEEGLSLKRLVKQLLFDFFNLILKLSGCFFYQYSA